MEVGTVREKCLAQEMIAAYSPARQTLEPGPFAPGKPYQNLKRYDYRAV